jgi:hypothetical protein
VIELLLAALLTRQATAFQAFLILLGKGLETQAQIILRNLAEMMFITGAIGKDKSFADKYVLAEDVSRLSPLRRSRETSSVAAIEWMAIRLG